MNDINFTGVKLNPIKIKKLASNGHYRPLTVNFVELNPKCKNDYRVTEQALCCWDAKFTEQIHNNMSYATYNNVPEMRFFALTTQKTKFKEMDPSKVLGLVQMTATSSENHIDFLQVNPQYMSRKNISWTGLLKKFLGISEKPKAPSLYKNVGTGILSSLKKNTDKDLTLDSVNNVVNFYIINDFVPTNPKAPKYMVWKLRNE